MKHGVACTHANQMRVWMLAHSKGWCPAFAQIYGKSWGNFVCDMEVGLDSVRLFTLRYK